MSKFDSTKKIVNYSLSSQDTKSISSDLREIDFWEKYSSHWKYATFLHLLSLLKFVKITKLDPEKLILEVKQDKYIDEKEYFETLSRLFSELCLVNVRIEPLQDSLDRKYEISVR